MAKNSCVDCTTPEAIPATEIKYGQGEPSPRRLRRHMRLADPVSGYSLYHCDDTYKTGFYLVSPQSANNLVTNPTFYVDLEGWSIFNSVITRTNDIAFDSGFSLRINGSGDQVTAERREYAEISTTEFLPGQPYTFTMYGWVPTIWDLSDPISLTISIADDLGNEIFSTPISKPGQWQRLTVSTVIDPGATEVFLRVNLRSQDQRENQPPFNLTGDYNLANEYAYFDMAQFEFGAEATTPFHGDTNTCASCDTNCGGYQWTGTPHSSSSTRDSCVRDGGKLVCLSDLGLEITSHTGHGAPPIRDISFPLNNRAGEFYQRSVADARVMTFTGQLCGTTLKDLECEIYGLGQPILPDLSPCSCCGKFLLIYHHEECDKNECDPERDLAICVTYIGGLEGNRTGLYHQQVALQFKAHDPFWFEWPGHSSAPLSFVKVVNTPNLISIASDGTARGFAIDGSNTYTSVACRSGLNSMIIGGDFDSINGDEDRCEENIAIWDCDEWVDLCLGLAGGQVNDLASDNQGNTLVAGSFGGPCSFIAIVYEDGTIGCFSGYPGGEAYAIIAPFYAQVVVGDDTGIHAQDFDGNWYTFATDGRVTGLSVDSAGNLYAVGEFTTVDGVETGSVAFININVGECPDLTTGRVESIGSTFNGNVNSVDINKDTGTVYMGGAFTEATPVPVDVCQVIDGGRLDSNGGNQQIQFRQIAGNNYQVEFYFLNIIARNTALQCIDSNNYLRVTGQSTFGTNYSLLIGRHNTVTNSNATVVIGADTFYTAVFDVDVGQTIGDPCETLNESIVDELDQSSAIIVALSPLDLPGGTGIDDTVSNLSAQCVFITESFQGDTVELNYVAQLSGGNLLPMGEGLDNEVNVIAVHPITGEVWAGTTRGLFIYNGLEWYEFPGLLGGDTETEILDIKFCGNGCETLVLYNSTQASVVQGTSEVYYGGNVQPAEMNLIIHGPGKVQSFHHNNTKNGMRFCTVLECNEIADLNFINGNYDSNFRDNLAPSILGGSRFDICLQSCDANDISMYISDDDAQTKATLLWRESFMGIEALCCKTASSSLQTVGTQASQAVEQCINLDYLAYHRDPNEDDCEDQGITSGDLWINIAGCPSMYIFTGTCEACDEFEGTYVDQSGTSITNAEGENYCPEDTDCEDFE